MSLWFHKKIVIIAEIHSYIIKFYVIKEQIVSFECQKGSWTKITGHYKVRCKSSTETLWP